MNPQIEEMANDTLQKFETISNQASQLLSHQPTNPSNALIADTPDNYYTAIENASRCINSVRTGYATLKVEPAVSRVVTRNIHDNSIKIYYITRGSSLPGNYFLASYHSPIGRLASLDILDEITIKNGTILELLEKSQLRPEHGSSGWDSINTVIENENIKTITIKSLRDLLFPKKDQAEIEDILSALQEEDADKSNIVQGKIRTIITKMVLRDQPILDKYQDEIFRLPLNMRLFLSGPPGTGKTTTLIRRLGQKLNYEHLESDERRVIERFQSSFDVPHDESWIMFTPTELLQQYIKEAFAREKVPAPDSTIKTWDNYRLDLSRNILNILKSKSGKNIFILKKYVEFLKDESGGELVETYKDFNKWQSNLYLSEVYELIKKIQIEKIRSGFIIDRNIIDDLNNDLIIIKNHYNTVINSLDKLSFIDFFIEISREDEKSRRIHKNIKIYTDEKVRGFLNFLLNKNKAFLDDFARYIDTLDKNLDEIQEVQDDLDFYDQDDDSPITPRSIAVEAYKDAIREYARLKATGQSLKAGSRRQKILEWLGDRIPDTEECIELGQLLQTQSALNRLSKPLDRYFRGIPKRYKEFRQLRQREGVWYTDVPITPTYIHPLELDIVLLSMLQCAHDLLKREEVFYDLQTARWSALKPVARIIRNQVLVDEVTDFSPIQIACMSCLSHPRIKSFFACGDFNQRLTLWGAKSPQEFQWLLPDIVFKEVSIAYRHSHQLNSLATAIIQQFGGHSVELREPKDMNNDCVSPVLGEHLKGEEEVAQWLSERIVEIDQAVGKMPSTAVFVNSEEEVKPLAEALNTILEDYNLRAVACSDGKVMGQDTDVRIFDVQHIKGLEFEAVFFVAIDQLANLHPQLFDKYLYVGATRAATYLGITCKESLPSSIAELRTHFISNWSV